MRFFGRAVLFCLGLVFAIPAGFMTLAVGTLIEPAAHELVTELGLAGADALLSDLWHGGPAAFDAAGVLVGLWALSAALLICRRPSSLSSARSPASARSDVFTASARASSRRPCPGSAGIGSCWSEGAMLGAEARITTPLFLTGAAAGLTYWLVAGPQRRDPLTLIPFPGRMKR